MLAAESKQGKHDCTRDDVLGSTQYEAEGSAGDGARYAACADLVGEGWSQVSAWE